MEFKNWKILQHLDPAFAADVKRVYLVGISSSLETDRDVDDDGETMDDLENSAYGGAVLIMRNDDVYFITRDPKKQLPAPLVHGTEGLLPLAPVKIGPLCGQRIRAVNSGHHHVVVLTADGRIYQWGYIHVEEEEENMILEPEFVSGDGIENKRVIQIACGQDHTAALTSEGDVYTWGSNYFGQLGTGREDSNETRPTKISGLNGFDAKISMVACSASNSLALDKDGTVWSWGECYYGVLGYDSCEPGIIPTKITSLENIKMIAAGNTHALALSHKRQVHFWGQHKSEEKTTTPKMIEIPNVAFIGATRGCTISAIQTAKRKVYYWGFACGHYIPDPVPTKFSTIAEVFASLDSPVMLEPLIIDLKPPVAEKLKVTFDDKSTGDFRFSVEGKVIYVHRSYLKLRSEHFGRMFDHNWKENGGKEVEITGFSYQGFRAFLFYLYTDGIDPAIKTVEDAIELLRLSDYYGEEDLKHRCERLLKVLITEDDVSKAYAVSCQYNANDLRQSALDFMVPRLNTIVKTDEFKKMPDDLKIRFLQELADENVLVGLKRRRLD